MLAQERLIRLPPNPVDDVWLNTLGADLSRVGKGSIAHLGRRFHPSEFVRLTGRRPSPRDRPMSLHVQGPATEIRCPPRTAWAARRVAHAALALGRGSRDDGLGSSVTARKA